MEPKPQKFVCHKCGSDDLDVEGTLSWNTITQAWDVDNITWEECRECSQKGDYEIGGVFVDDNSLKTIILQTIHKEENP